MTEKIVFIGGCWKNDVDQYVLNNTIGAPQIAANNLQNNLIEGFSCDLGVSTKVISGLFVGSFPSRFKKAVIAKEEIVGGVDEPGAFEYVSFINVPILKHLSKALSMRRSLSRFLGSCEPGEKVSICGYSMTLAVVLTLLAAKKSFPWVKTCLIVPDLPEYMNLGKKRRFADFIKKIVNRFLYEKIRKIDSFVVLTEKMYSALNVDKPYVVVEGIAPAEPPVFSSDLSFKGDASQSCSKSRIVAYTGTLDEKYGVRQLVDAFMSIDDPHLELIICGCGDTVPYIEKCAACDSRILYEGSVSNRDAKLLQRQACLLVNPRESNEEYTAYSFPSKVLEYMVSGTPVLMNRLDGVPEEYDDYLFYVDGDLASSMAELLSLDDSLLEQKGASAKKFAVSEKNARAQSSRIIELLRSL